MRLFKRKIKPYPCKICGKLPTVKSYAQGQLNWVARDTETVDCQIRAWVRGRTIEDAITKWNEAQTTTEYTISFEDRLKEALEEALRVEYGDAEMRGEE